jgi:hypothetical protein
MLSGIEKKAAESVASPEPIAVGVGNARAKPSAKNHPEAERPAGLMCFEAFIMSNNITRGRFSS